MKSIFKAKVVKCTKSCSWNREEYAEMKKRYESESSTFSWNYAEYHRPRLYQDEILIEMKEIHSTDKFATILKEEYIEVNDKIHRIEKSYFNQDGAVVYYLDTIIEDVTEGEQQIKNEEEQQKYDQALKEKEEIDIEITEAKNKTMEEEIKKLEEEIRREEEEEKNKYIVSNDPDDSGKVSFLKKLFKKIFD